MKKDKAAKLIDQAIDCLADALDQGHSQVLTQYLATMAAFHQYSLHNVLLIVSQRPNATHVAGFNAWKKLGRYVRKGEKGIVILAPLLYKVQPQQHNEPSHSNYQVNGFKPVYVFDISQTSGHPLPAPATTLGNPGQLTAALDQLIAQLGIALQYVHHLGAEGVSSGGTIIIRTGLAPAHEFSVKVHELAHELLHKVEQRPSKTQIETEAEAVAHVVCSAVGLDTNTASSDYIQLYNGNRDTLMKSLTRIKHTAEVIIQAIS